jgi:hypothetical protein
VENKRTQKLAFLETSVAEDGTLWIHIVGFDQQQNYKINMVPCIPVYFGFPEMPAFEFFCFPLLNFDRL